MSKAMYFSSVHYSSSLHENHKILEMGSASVFRWRRMKHSCTLELYWIGNAQYYNIKTGKSSISSSSFAFTTQQSTH
jgi:hypothetical protein